MTVYLQALKLDKDAFVQAVELSLFIGTVIWAISLYSEGTMNADALILSTIAVPPILVGMVIGQWLRGRIPEAQFRTAIHIILIRLSANLIRKGLL